jgi:group I intron endonuclease
MQKKIKIIGIYKITSPTGKYYIGQSTDVIGRKNKYSTLKCKSQPKIYRSLMKYGWDNHIFDIIEECDIEQLDDLEFKWKLFYNSVDEGLNCHYVDLNGGYKSEETKKKMSNSHIGKHKLSKKHIDIIIKTNTGNQYNVGRKHSEESNLKRNLSIKETRKTKKWECGRKKGWQMSEDQKKILRAPKSEEAKQNMRKPRSEQGKLNMRVPKPNSQKPVFQYNFEGNFIKEWKSITDAYLFFGKSINSSGITCCLKGKQKTAYGFIWKEQKI